MVFNSYAFALFLPVVLGGYWLLRGHRRQNLWLLAASYVFYAAWDVRFLALMWFTTVVDFVVGRRLQHLADDDRARRRTLLASLVANLGVLAAFKYYGFFVDSFDALAGRVGLELSPPVLHLLLPVGISFYTFHGISYTVDVYRRQIDAVDDLPTFAVFVAYFPQLVAGPIGRAQSQLPQFTTDRTPPDGDRVASAVSLILLGLVKKVVVADALAGSVDQVFASSARASSATLLLGAYGFALQIYGDFSGYTDIARGVSRLFGIELLENFRQPYLSHSITEFWRRWHISLSTWLRDYLYVPLGGNRRGRRRTTINLLLTMVIGGLWHGAAWTFVAWGAIHGVLLAIDRRRRPAAHPGRGRRLVEVAVTFHLVVAAWVVFRASSIHQAVTYLTRLPTAGVGPVDWSLLAAVVVSGAIVLAVDLAQQRADREDVALAWPAPVQGALAGVAVLLLVLYSGGAGAPFIYFRF